MKNPPSIEAIRKMLHKYKALEFESTCWITNMLFLKETYIGMYRGREIDGFIQEFEVKPYFIFLLNKPNLLLIN